MSGGAGGNSPGKPSRPTLRPDVALRPVQDDDAAAMYRWMCDPAVAANIGLRAAPSPEKTRAWIAKAAGDASVAPRAVLLGGRHVGNVVLDQIDPLLAMARLSVYVGEPDARGRGVGFTAVYRALEEAFGPLRLNKVWLTVHGRNVAAVNTYLRLGFALEGIHREEFVLDGQRINLLYMGLLAADFRRLEPEGPPVGE